MEIFSILTEQIALFVIYMLVGVLMVKTQVLNKTTLETISRFVIKLSMPVMIFINTVNGVDRATLFSSVCSVISAYQASGCPFPHQKRHCPALSGRVYVWKRRLYGHSHCHQYFP